MVAEGMGKREKVYLKDTAIWDSIDHEASAEQTPEVYAKLDTLTHGSEKKLVWKCSSGHLWQAKIYNRSNGHGCPFCSGLRASDANRLLTNRPDLAREWDSHRNELNLYDMSVSSGQRAWWRCSENHSWQSAICDRSKGNGCPFCSGRRLSDINRLSLIRPDLVCEWDYAKNGISPYDVSVWSNQSAWWRCSENHSWRAIIANRSKGRGCPKCAKRTSKIENRFIKVFAEKTDFTVTAHGMRLNNLKYESGHSGVEVDITLYHNHHYLLLEYDGRYWHRDRVESDTEKSRLLLPLGDNIFHARIRESGLPELDLVHDRFAQFQHDYHASESDSIEGTVKEIEHWFLEKIGE